MGGNQAKELSELKDLVKSFLMYTEQWLKDEIIDKDTYERIRQEKLKLIGEYE